MEKYKREKSLVEVLFLIDEIENGIFETANFVNRKMCSLVNLGGRVKYSVKN